MIKKSLLTLLLLSAFSVTAAELYAPQKSYTAGSMVEIDGKTYKAKWWANPGQSPIDNYTNEWDSPWQLLSEDPEGNLPEHVDGAPYQEGFVYEGGDIVANEDAYYRCIPGASVPWCAGVAWAYEPGVGSAWNMAWEPTDFNPVEAELYTVTTTVNGEGSIAPASLTVTAGDPAAFTIKVTNNSTLKSVTGCEGTLTGDQYVLEKVQANCQVVVDFDAIDAPPSIAFNQNEWPSDLDGSLEGTVLFAQTNTFPSKYMLENDIQPHLIAQRDALMLFKPTMPLDESSAVLLQAKDANGNLLGTVDLARPYQLPLIDGQQPGFQLDPLPEVSPDKQKTINVDSVMNDEAGAGFAALLADYDRINVDVYSVWGTKTFTLPKPTAEQNFEDKLIHFNGTKAHEVSTVAYSDRKIYLRASDPELTFRYSQGTWYMVDERDEQSINAHTYGHGFWHTRLPADWVQPGLVLEFSHQDMQGTLSDVNVGALTELQLNTIDVGMLTEPRDMFDLADSEQFQRDYFETVPVSRMIVNRYLPLHLTEIMLANGDLLVDLEPSKGTWLGGRLRQEIAKVLISHGINNANYGLNSSFGLSEAAQPYLAAQITVHNAVGVYSNGKVQHGGSGGNGMATLDNTRGNELSHELGHNYGLGHYEGGIEGSLHQTAEKVNSSWGWNSEKNVFIPNFVRLPDGKESCISNNQCVEAYQQHSMTSDAMAAAIGAGTYSAQPYTLYTPYSLHYIQKTLESKVIFSSQSPTGYLKWNSETEKMEPFSHMIPTESLFVADINKVDSSEYIEGLLAEYGQVEVKTKNYQWAEWVHIPVASSDNIDNRIKFNIRSGFGVRVMAGDTEIKFPAHNGLFVYISDGEQWIYQAEYVEGEIERTPEKMGTSVVTLLGYYDPKGEKNSYIYPALEGAYGMTYSDDSDILTDNDCSLNVTLKSGEKLGFKLNNVHYEEEYMNKFHINIAREQQPVSSELVCYGKSLHTRDITLSPVAPTYTVIDNQFKPTVRK